MERDDEQTADAWTATSRLTESTEGDGPDYLALVISWDDELERGHDAQQLERDDEQRAAPPHDALPVEPLSRPRLPTRSSRVLRGLALGFGISLGALGALVAARWGLHKLREA